MDGRAKAGLIDCARIAKAGRVAPNALLASRIEVRFKGVASIASCVTR